MTRFKIDKYLLILGVVSVLFMASVVRYSLKSYYYPVWDEQYYMHMASTYWRLLQDTPINTINELITFQGVKQMGYPILILPFLLIFGLKDAYFWALVTNGFLYVATIFGVYLIARNYLGGLSSFLSAIIFSCYSWTLFHVHFAYNETASSATIVWTIYFLIKSNSFRNRTYSILFGLFFGFALLTRWVAPVFLAGPLIYVGFQIARKKLYKDKQIILNILFSILGVFAIAFYPYYINRELIFSYFYGHRVGGEMWQMLPQNEKARFSIFTLTFYLNSFNTLGTYFFALFMAGFILAFKKPIKLMPILLAVMLPWIFFSFFSILKADRFIVPIYPYVAILSASVFDCVKNFRAKTALIILTLALSIGTFLGTDWGKGPMRQSLLSIQLPVSFGEVSKIYLTSISRPPYIYKISGREIVEYLASQKIDEQIVSLYYYKPLNEPLMAYNLYHQEKLLNIVGFLGTTVTDSEESSKILKTVIDSNYIMVKTGESVDDSFSKTNTRLLEALAKLFSDDVNLEKYYEETKRFWVYQDSSEVVIYRKKSEVSEEEYERLRAKLIEYLK